MNLTVLNIILLGIIGLLGVGVYGLLITRNLIKVVMVLQILVRPSFWPLFFLARSAATSGWDNPSRQRSSLPIPLWQSSGWHWRFKSVVVLAPLMPLSFPH